MLRFLFAVLLLRRFGGLLIFLLSTVVALVWADALLTVTEKSIEIVLDSDELLEFTDAESSTEADSKSMAADEHTTLMESQETSKTQPESTGTQDAAPSESPKVAEQEAADAAAQAVDSLMLADAPASHPHSPATEGEVTAVEDERESEPLVENQTTPAEDNNAMSQAGQFPAVQSGGEGSLASFSGHGVSSEGNPTTTGGGSGPTWNVTFAHVPAIDHLRQIEGTTLAVVRQRRGFSELAVIGDRAIGEVTTVDEFISLEPRYQARQGIQLPREWMADYADRLLKYGGGWQLWLLIEDNLFLKWYTAATAHVSEQGHQWQNIEKITAVVQLRRSGSRWAAEIVFRDAQVREAPAEKEQKFVP